ncbi:SsrA-binding protein SmpB [Puniceicoccaceae bacterium K14]|nr:SsrA-binding protein SmpB [Puniceicoccaceae bacterium K14]
MAAKKKKYTGPSEIRNAKARRDYIVEDILEAGIVLTGTEVKSIRGGNVQLSDGFCRFSNVGELFVQGVHIDEYSFGTMNNHIPRRERKLLLKSRELVRLRRAVEAGGKAIVPLRMYFKESLIKVELGLCVGKKLFDKRDDLKKKAVMRDEQQSLKEYRFR